MNSGIVEPYSLKQTDEVTDFKNEFTSLWMGTDYPYDILWSLTSSLEFFYPNMD